MGRAFIKATGIKVFDLFLFFPNLTSIFVEFPRYLMINNLLLFTYIFHDASQRANNLFLWGHGSSVMFYFKRARCVLQKVFVLSF